MSNLEQNLSLSSSNFTSKFKLFDLVPLENIRQGNAKDKELARKEAELARMQQMLEKMQMQLQQQQNAPSSHQL